MFVRSAASIWRRACSNGFKGEAVNTSIIVGSIALVLAGLLATGHAFGQEATSVPLLTGQEKMEQRETVRKAQMLDHQKRREDFARNCIKPALSEAQLETCRAAYRKL